MIVKKRILNAVFKTIVVFATLHIIILVIYAVTTGDISVLNLFNILEINLFFFVSSVGLLSNVFSIAMITAVYIFIYFK